MTPPSAPPSLFLTTVGFALSRAFLFGFLNIVLLLILKSYATYISALSAPTTGSADGWVGFFLPFFCIVGFGVAFAILTASLFVGGILSVISQVIGPAKPLFAIVTLIVSLFAAIPFQLVAYYHFTNTVNNQLTEGTDYVAYYLLPSLFVVLIGWLTYRRIVRFIRVATTENTHI